MVVRRSLNLCGSIARRSGRLLRSPAAARCHPARPGYSPSPRRPLSVVVRGQPRRQAFFRLVGPGLARRAASSRSIRTAPATSAGAYSMPLSM
jgi:hypothetical protein